MWGRYDIVLTENAIKIFLGFGPPPPAPLNTKKGFYPPKFLIILPHKKLVILMALEAEVEMNHPDFFLKPELGKNLCNLRNLKNGMIYHQK